MTRNYSFDGLRAYGVLTVLLTHSISALNLNYVYQEITIKSFFDIQGIYNLALKLLLVLFNGHAVIAIFFILSGMVLFHSLLYQAKQNQRYLGISFLIKRVVRIYFPMIPCLLVFYCLLSFLHFFKPDFYPSVLYDFLVKNCLLISPLINGATWTLQIEAISIVFVLFAFYSYQKWGVNALILQFILSLILFNNHWLENYYIIGNFNASIFYFYLGFLCAVFPADRFKKELSAFGWFLPLIVIIFIRSVISQDKAGVFLEACAAAFLLVYLKAEINNKFTTLLSVPYLQYLGKISYSLYLWNILFLLIFQNAARFNLIANHPLEFGLLAFFIIYKLTLPIAEFAEKNIEQPCLKIGKILANYASLKLNLMQKIVFYRLGKSNLIK